MSRKIIYLISRQNGDVAEATMTVDAAADTCGHIWLVNSSNISERVSISVSNAYSRRFVVLHMYGVFGIFVVLMPLKYRAWI